MRNENKIPRNTRRKERERGGGEFLVQDARCLQSNDCDNDGEVKRSIRLSTSGFRVCSRTGVKEKTNHLGQCHRGLASIVLSCKVSPPHSVIIVRTGWPPRDMITTRRIVPVNKQLFVLIVVAAVKGLLECKVKKKQTPRSGTTTQT